MNSRDRRDAGDELKGAADIGLTEDFAMLAWEQGQRARARTAWTLGGGIAAAAAIVMMLGGPNVGFTSSNEPIPPAGVTTDGPGPDQVSAPEPSPEDTTTTSDDAATVTDDSAETPPDSSASPGSQDPIPLGNGVAMRPISGWQPVWQMEASRTFRGPYDLFETCLQPEGSQISRVTCFDGVIITTGIDTDHEDVLAWAEQTVPEWDTGLKSVDPDSDTYGGAATLSFDEVAAVLVAAPKDSVLSYAVLADGAVTDDGVTGFIKERYGSKAPTTESLTVSVDEKTLCTKDNGTEAPAQVIPCEVLKDRIEADPSVPISVVYDESNVALRMSEDPRNIG